MLQRRNFLSLNALLYSRLQPLSQIPLFLQATKKSDFISRDTSCPIPSINILILLYYFIQSIVKSFNGTTRSCQICYISDLISLF